jgi:hypothetical protein
MNEGGAGVFAVRNLNGGIGAVDRGR